MPNAVRISDLSAMTARERARVLSRLSKDAADPPNGALDSATARVRAFEQRYEFSSETLLERLRKGEQRETAEVAEWLFYLKLTTIGR